MPNLIIAKVTRPPEPERTPKSPLALVWSAMTDMVRRIAVLEGAPRPEPVDLAPVNARIDAMYAAMAERGRRGEPDEAAIERLVDARVAAAMAALPRPEPVDLAPVNARIDAMYAAVASSREAIDVERMIADKVAASVAALPPAQPGKDADPVVIEAMVLAAIARLPAPDAPEVTGADLAAIRSDLESLRTALADAARTIPDPIDLAALKADTRAMLTSGLDDMQAMIAAIPAPPELPDIGGMVADAVADAVAKLPPPEPGKSVEPEAVAEMVRAEAERILAGWERPRDGKSVTVEDVAPVIAEAVQEAVAALPKAADGVGIADVIVTAEGRLAVVLTDQRRIDAGPVVPEAIPGPPGRSIEAAAVNDDGHLIVTLTDETEIDAGYVVGEPGDSVKGDEGRGIAALRIDGVNLVAEYSDGEKVDLGRVVGNDGKPGMPGKPGESIKGEPGDQFAFSDTYEMPAGARLRVVEMADEAGVSRRMITLD